MNELDYVFFEIYCELKCIWLTIVLCVLEIRNKYLELKVRYMERRYKRMIKKYFKEIQKKNPKIEFDHLKMELDGQIVLFDKEGNEVNVRETEDQYS